LPRKRNPKELTTFGPLTRISHATRVSITFKKMGTWKALFLSNYRSEKAKLSTNNKVFLPFSGLKWNPNKIKVCWKIIWKSFGRLFWTRPRGSQIGAWASPQSKVIPDKKFLQKRYKEYEKKYEGKENTKTSLHWGGYIRKTCRNGILARTSQPPARPYPLYTARGLLMENRTFGKLNIYKLELSKIKGNKSCNESDLYTLPTSPIK